MPRRFITRRGLIFGSKMFCTISQDYVYIYLYLKISFSDTTHPILDVR